MANKIGVSLLKYDEFNGAFIPHYLLVPVRDGVSLGQEIKNYAQNKKLIPFETSHGSIYQFDPRNNGFAIIPEKEEKQIYELVTSDMKAEKKNMKFEKGASIYIPVNGEQKEIIRGKIKESSPGMYTQRISKGKRIILPIYDIYKMEMLIAVENELEGEERKNHLNPDRDFVIVNPLGMFVKFYDLNDLDKYFI